MNWIFCVYLFQILWTLGQSIVWTKSGLKQKYKQNAEPLCSEPNPQFSVKLTFCGNLYNHLWQSFFLWPISMTGNYKIGHIAEEHKHFRFICTHPNLKLGQASIWGWSQGKVCPREVTSCSACKWFDIEKALISIIKSLQIDGILVSYLLFS